MWTKISLFKKSIFTLISLSLFIIGCNSPKLEYTIETTLNPNNISPLTATLQINTDKPCSVHVKVLGDIPVEQSIEDFKTGIARLICEPVALDMIPPVFRIPASFMSQEDMCTLHERGTLLLFATSFP